MVEEKMIMLKKLPEEVLNLLNNWEIRGMVLLSLLLQAILIVFGPRRKTNARSWIRILIWSAYLSADVVATVALGNLARSQGDSSGDSSEKANNSIQAFWAPFLLLHLGGPDTITAYSIEDNELWLRHLLGLVVQVIVAFYVFSRSWGSGILTFIAIPMFVVSIAKYAERTWVLWSSCSKSLKNSSLRDFWRSSDRLEIQAHQQDYLLQANVFSYISKFMMQDLVAGIPELIRSRELISKNKADGAFKVVEAELGLVYDMLYTKASLIYSRGGIILRCISSLLFVTAFITFQVKIDKYDYTTTDIAITYLLFAAAVFLEFYAFLCLVLSDWTMIWLEDEGWNAQNSAIYYLIRKLTRSERWSRSISQYNLISSSIKSEPPRCLGLLGIDEMMRQMHVNRKDLNVGLQGPIFKHLQKKAKKIKEDLNVCDKNVRSKIIGQRGDGVLEREGLLRDYKWCTTQVEFSRSIIVWHLATDICYRADKDGSNVSKEYERSRCLSEYMMYLLVMRPNMLSKGFGDDEAYQATLRELRALRGLKDDQRNFQALHGLTYQVTLRELWGLKDSGPDDEGYQRALRELRNSESHVYDDGLFQSVWITEKSVLIGVDKLAWQLLLLEPEKRWRMINEVWVEMVAYAAAHCPWKEHTQQLRRGGELLTHVSLLMLHLGLTKQYEIHDPDRSVLQGCEYNEYAFDSIAFDQLKIEEELEYNNALCKYLKGAENMSESSLDEELKKLKKIVANKDRVLKHQQRELEHKDQELEQLRSSLTASAPQQGVILKELKELKKIVADKDQVLEHQQQELKHKDQELEQLRSSLTASAPQQGVDSLPTSLPAQTDDQRIN